MGLCFDVWNSSVWRENFTCTSWQKAARRAPVLSTLHQTTTKTTLINQCVCVCVHESGGGGGKHFTNHHRNTHQCVCALGGVWKGEGSRYVSKGGIKNDYLSLPQERVKLKNLTERGQVYGESIRETEISFFLLTRLRLNSPIEVTLQSQPHLDFSPDWQLT